VLQATEVGAVWGIGRKTSAKLNERGIHTVFDALQAEPTALRRPFGVVLEKTLRELRGTRCIEVDDVPPANQQIMCARTFGAPVTDLASLGESIGQFASRVAEKLRAQRGVAGAVQVFMATSPYRTHDAQHSPSATVPLRPPSADTRVIASAAQRALEAMHRPGFHYVRAGVVLLDIQPEGRPCDEPDLFGDDTEQPPIGRDRRRLMAAMDTLNHRYGRGAVHVASAAQHTPHGDAGAKQHARSPRYTTRLDEVIVAGA
jgi:DNA polymerase V